MIVISDANTKSKMYEDFREFMKISFHLPFTDGLRICQTGEESFFYPLYTAPVLVCRSVCGGYSVLGYVCSSKRNWNIILFFSFFDQSIV